MAVANGLHTLDHTHRHDTVHYIQYQTGGGVGLIQPACSVLRVPRRLPGKGLLARITARHYETRSNYRSARRGL